MKKVFIAIVTALAFTAAGAQSSVSAGWSGLTFQLEDLNVSDGISPSLIATGARSTGLDLPTCGVSGVGPVAPDYRPLSAKSYSAFVKPSINEFSVAACFDEITYFQLSPHTRVKIMGSIFADSTGPSFATELVDDLLFSFTMSAIGFSEVEFIAGLLDDQHSVTSNLGRSEGSFRFILDSTDTPNDFSLRFKETVSARILTSITVVPEPETYALMLTGLGAVGFAARRRRT